MAIRRQSGAHSIWERGTSEFYRQCYPHSGGTQNVIHTALETALLRTQSHPTTHSLCPLGTWKNSRSLTHLFQNSLSDIKSFHHPDISSWSTCWNWCYSRVSPWIPSEMDTFLGTFPCLAFRHPPTSAAAPSPIYLRGAAAHNCLHRLQEGTCCFHIGGVLSLPDAPVVGLPQLWGCPSAENNEECPEPGQGEVKLGRSSDSTEWMILNQQRANRSLRPWNTGIIHCRKREGMRKQGAQRQSSEIRVVNPTGLPIVPGIQSRLCTMVHEASRGPDSACFFNFISYTQPLPRHSTPLHTHWPSFCSLVLPTDSQLWVLAPAVPSVWDPLLECLCLAESFLSLSFQV